jgi:NADPH:quinone reductase-like Zn-dependent oxidoreductase
VTALQGLRRHGEIAAGQRVLVNGAAGGVGHFAVQLAKAAGAEVTGVTSTRNIDLVRSLGADHVIDYTREDFSRAGRTWDRILDAVGNRSAADLRRALAPGGRCAVIGFTTTGRLLDVMLRGGKEIAMVSAHATAADLERLGELISAGTLRPAIDRRYPFSELPEALRYLEAGHARGKVVVGDVG